MLRLIRQMASKVKVKDSRSKKQKLMSEYRKAAAEHRRLTKYLKATAGLVSKAERSLLLDFAELARQKCERLRRAIRQHTARDAA
jgi:hypothetical protein